MHFDQALIQFGESHGEPRFKISWSKGSKKFGVGPVLEKSYKYLEDVLQAAISLANSGTKPAPKVKDKASVMTLAERPNRKDIIDTTQRLSRFRYIKIVVFPLIRTVKLCNSNDLDQALYICSSQGRPVPFLAEGGLRKSFFGLCKYIL